MFSTETLSNGNNQSFLKVISSIDMAIAIYARSSRHETLGWENEDLISHPRRGSEMIPLDFHTNAGLKVKSTARFRKMYHSKIKNR